jgi:putative ABC transport system permease protein
MRYEARIPFFLIARHLVRGSKWQLVLIIFLMSIAFINLVFITSLFNGIIKSSNDQIIDTSTGDVYITPNEGHDFIEDSGSTIGSIEDTSGVKAASARMLVPANMKFENKKGNFMTFAIDPENEKEVTIISKKMVSGSYLDADDTDSIILGRQIAGGPDVENISSFKTAKVGDKVTLSFDSIKHEFMIKGIFDTNYIETDYRAFITQKALKKIAPHYNDKATSIAIKIDNKGEEKKIVSRLKDKNLGLSIYPWQDMAGMMKSVEKSFISIDVLLGLVGGMIAAVTIFIVIYIDISNKRQQIGILRAIGIKPYLIRTVYVLQSTFYSVCGVILGTGIFFAVLVPYFKAHPFVLPLGDAILIVNYPDFVLRAEIVIWVAIISGLIPAIFVTRMPMLDEILGK